MKKFDMNKVKEYLEQEHHLLPIEHVNTDCSLEGITLMTNAENNLFDALVSVYDWQVRDGNWFSAKLVSLYSQADTFNRGRLAEGFPYLSAAFSLWYTSTVTTHDMRVAMAMPHAEAERAHVLAVLKTLTEEVQS